MEILVLILLVLTGGAPPAVDGTATGATPTVSAPEGSGGSTTAEGGDAVRKSPIN